MNQRPQARFDDLYSAAYAILDDAKTSHNLVKLYKGSHGLRQLGFTSASPEDVTVFCGGAKGVFLAFFAALMCTRVYDELHHSGRLPLAPEFYYQSLRLIPPVYGGDIAVISELTGAAVRDWLAATAGESRRAIYAPLVNNCDGRGPVSPPPTSHAPCAHPQPGAPLSAYARTCPVAYGERARLLMCVKQVGLCGCVRRGPHTMP